MPAAYLDRMMRPLHRWVWADLDRRVRKLLMLFVDRYDIIDKIGQGGMASVFRARDSRSKTEKLVAIKLFGGNGDSEAWKRLRQETRVVLRHDNIVEIFEAGEHEVCRASAVQS